MLRKRSDKMLKIVFMGTPDFARVSLEKVYDAGHKIEAVVTNVDKPKGRGMKLVPSPVKQFAEEKGIKILQPLKVKNNNFFIEEIKQLNPDVICVVAYGKILPKELLDIPKLGCINVHGSLLPQYRGAAPIQWSVLNGDKKTGITTMYMDVGMDTGDMILKEETEIGDNETTGELWGRLSILGGDLLVKTLKLIEEGKAPREKQGEDFTTAPMLNKEIAKIDWETKNAEQIKNLVRGLNPIMGAYSYINGKKIKFWKVEVISERDLEKEFPELVEYNYKLKEIGAGTVLFSDAKKGLYIKANDGIIKVLELQGENARKMSSNDFLRGNSIGVGSMFE